MTAVCKQCFLPPLAQNSPVVTYVERCSTSLLSDPMSSGGIPDGEKVVGRFLHLATTQGICSSKSWFTLAGWCYKWGRKSLDSARWVYLHPATHRCHHRRCLLRQFPFYGVVWQYPFSSLKSIVYSESIHVHILSDCLAPGFLGSSSLPPPVQSHTVGSLEC